MTVCVRNWSLTQWPFFLALFATGGRPIGDCMKDVGRGEGALGKERWAKGDGRRLSWLPPLSTDMMMKRRTVGAATSVVVSTLVLKY
jgi:hypothetical protein